MLTFPQKTPQTLVLCIMVDVAVFRSRCVSRLALRVVIGLCWRPVGGLNSFVTLMQFQQSRRSRTKRPTCCSCTFPRHRRINAALCKIKFFSTKAGRGECGSATFTPTIYAAGRRTPGGPFMPHNLELDFGKERAVTLAQWVCLAQQGLTAPLFS